MDPLRHRSYGRRFSDIGITQISPRSENVRKKRLESGDAVIRRSPQIRRRYEEIALFGKSQPFLDNEVCSTHLSLLASVPPPRNRACHCQWLYPNLARRPG